MLWIKTQIPLELFLILLICDDFQGVGISLLVAQAVMGLYTIVGIAWMFFYFRDSFIAQEDRYKWTKCYDQIRGCMPPTNYSFSLEDTIPDYFQ